MHLYEKFINLNEHLLCPFFFSFSFVFSHWDQEAAEFLSPSTSRYFGLALFYLFSQAVLGLRSPLSLDVLIKQKVKLNYTIFWLLPTIPLNYTSVSIWLAFQVFIRDILPNVLPQHIKVPLFPSPFGFFMVFLLTTSVKKMWKWKC